MTTQPHERAVNADHVSGVNRTLLPSHALKRWTQRATPPTTADAQAMLDLLVNNAPVPHPSIHVLQPVVTPARGPLPRRWLGHGALAALLLATIGGSALTTRGHPVAQTQANVSRSIVGVGPVAQAALLPPAIVVAHPAAPPVKKAAPVDQVSPRERAVAHNVPVRLQPTPLATATPVTGPPTAQIIDDRTNLRSGPGTDFDKVVKLNHAAQVKLVSRHGNWFSVETADGIRGWIEQSLITMAPGSAGLVAETQNVPQLPTAVPTKTSVAIAAIDPTSDPTAVPTARPKPTQTPEPAPQVLRAARVASWVWPTSGDITSPFGYRDFEVAGSSFHNGIDISNSRWTSIAAARSGTVIEAGWCSGYGYCVIMDHGDGFTTEYGHMASNPIVYAGQEVSAGQQIGYMGSTYDLSGGGYSTGVHLHFTIKLNGRAVDPMRFLP